MYPHAEKAAIELLQRMLTFGRLNIRMNEWIDPDKRITVQQALESEFVASVRRPECEVLWLVNEWAIEAYYTNNGISFWIWIRWESW